MSPAPGIPYEHKIVTLFICEPPSTSWKVQQNRFSTLQPRAAWTWSRPWTNAAWKIPDYRSTSTGCQTRCETPATDDVCDALPTRTLRCAASKPSCRPETGTRNKLLTILRATCGNYDVTFLPSFSVTWTWTTSEDSRDRKHVTSASGNTCLSLSLHRSRRTRQRSGRMTSYDRIDGDSSLCRCCVASITNKTRPVTSALHSLK